MPACHLACFRNLIYLQNVIQSTAITRSLFNDYVTSRASMKADPVHGRA